MAVNAFLTFKDKADGESIQKGKEKWIEIQGWDWDVEAETSWTKGGGASVGKPNPGKLNFEHYFDTSSTVILSYICTGKAFPEVQLEMMKTTGAGSPETYFAMKLLGVFITKVSQSGTEEGNVVQKVEVVFKDITIDYQRQDNLKGTLMAKVTFHWDIPGGMASAS
jgi:type VI secretion system secreted protein Hcp